VTSADPPDAGAIPEQFRIRREKRARLLAEGREPYPVAVERTHTLAEVRAAHPDLPIDTATDDIVGVAGRVIFARNSGKLCFATLQDGDGTTLQVMVSLDKVGQSALDAWKADVDLGDIVYVHGNVISSRRGELSVLADSWQMASKSLRPLPVAHKEMSEESRVRQRYVDLIVRPQARAEARQRIAVVRAIRNALERRGFVEVETPMLQTLAGGAAARPFTTHSNAGHRSVPADRAGTVPQALHRRWFRQGLRAKSSVSKRRSRFDPFSGILHAGDLPDLRNL
jgi:lysyl-tRNA synthetase class 2